MYAVRLSPVRVKWTNTIKLLSQTKKSKFARCYKKSYLSPLCHLVTHIDRFHRPLWFSSGLRITNRPRIRHHQRWPTYTGLMVIIAIDFLPSNHVNILSKLYEPVGLAKNIAITEISDYRRKAWVENCYVA